MSWAYRPLGTVLSDRHYLREMFMSKHGFIIAGHQSMECSFVQNAPIPPAAYQGALNTVGLDIGITAGGVLGWAVFAPTVGIPAGSLAGEYVGASGDIGLGVGVGAEAQPQA
jgi:hypothetical protein